MISTELEDSLSLEISDLSDISIPGVSGWTSASDGDSEDDQAFDVDDEPDIFGIVYIMFWF